MEIFRRSAEKGKRFTAATYRIRQCWNARQYLTRFDSREK